MSNNRIVYVIGELGGFKYLKSYRRVQGRNGAVKHEVKTTPDVLEALVVKIADAVEALQAMESHFKATPKRPAKFVYHESVDEILAEMEAESKK